jgi:hypothetical protein
MAKVETVELANPIEWFSKKVTVLKIKEPTGHLYVTIGEPRILVHTNSGGGYFVEQPAAITQYLERCIDHEAGADVLKLLSLEDAAEVKEVLLSFFEAVAQSRLARRLTRSSSGSPA